MPCPMSGHGRQTQSSQLRFNVLSPLFKMANFSCFLSLLSFLYAGLLSSKGL